MSVAWSAPATSWSRAAPLAAALILSSAPAGAGEPRPTESQFSLKLTLGGDYRSLFGVPIYGGDGSLGLGVKMGATAIYGTVGVLVGSTEGGLSTMIYEIGCSFEHRIDRFAFGLVLRPSYLHIDRVTSTGYLDSLGFGAAPFVGFDLLAYEEHVLFLSASVNLDEYTTGSTAFAWGPTLSVGYRE